MRNGNTDTIFIMVQKTSLRAVVPYHNVRKVADGKALTVAEGFKKHWGERKISYKHLVIIQDCG